MTILQAHQTIFAALITKLEKAEILEFRLSEPQDYGITDTMGAWLTTSNETDMFTAWDIITNIRDNVANEVEINVSARYGELKIDYQLAY